MKVDVLAAEIGSTTTVVNAFDGLNSDCPRLLGQGQAFTTVSDSGDKGVTVGLANAVDDLRKSLGARCLDYGEMLATSSAAGGLRMTVHGLVYDMTVRAAKEAALGAGANLKLVTAGVLTSSDLSDIEQIRPNLILLAGGTDYGERETALRNAEMLGAARIRPPVIYAGNVQNKSAIRSILEKAGFTCYITENVYPRLDNLNIEPARRIIHAVFEEHITKAPGMLRVRDMVNGVVMPTPGAVMECARLLYNSIGDVLVIDAGGATTDIHSVTGGADEIAAMAVYPEPFAKRTVEGDLGLFVNARNVVELAGEKELSIECGADVKEILRDYRPIPRTSGQLALAKAIAWRAASTALTRHAGKFRFVYTPSGRKTIAEGKDLTRVRYLIGTGGALTRLPGRDEILLRLRDMNSSNALLLPKPGEMRILQDHNYIMASLGALSVKYPDAALRLLLESLRLDDKSK
ncbi:MAG: glutamate mutase L [Clostridiales bacterium]|jgi:uncharacterized protein (TIGR01319 family)|nr:glutamate mutase L [Clostridiales bacterium]